VVLAEVRLVFEIRSHIRGERNMSRSQQERTAKDRTQAVSHDGHFN